MFIIDAAKSRAEELISEVDELTKGSTDPTAIPLQTAKEHAWFVATEHVIDVLCPNPRSSYRQWISERKATIKGQGRGIGSITLFTAKEVLRRLLKDLDQGLLSDVAAGAAAETFDDFLDHAAHYLKEGQKDVAGVIAGVAFEDAVTRICKKYEIETDDRTLEKLINALKADGKISGIKAKSAKAAADLRGSATHANWDRYGEDDVRAAIDLTRSLITDHLEA